ncbi:hypothetical protein E8D34_17315 [Nocardioides sp. GY 10113]|uniref:hypothetical protein n=1 Tax=Nocardioides sp. GY 10113 TaxID=2569761 RepID=UPI0010A88F74|nr:hypothetical protein [Nocardioides sp. GY 10113]TIC82237.1 hypothetical protein E8D34_17315 [Nocardioides sp. GY 10113]
MTRHTRPFRGTAAAVVLLGGLIGPLAACGGDGETGGAGEGTSAQDAPTDAPLERFCELANDSSWMTEVADGDYAGMADALHAYVAELEELGTPADIPADAREGFVILNDAVARITAEGLEKVDNSADLDGADPFGIDLTAEQQDKINAYNVYQAEACAD